MTNNAGDRHAYKYTQTYKDRQTDRQADGQQHRLIDAERRIKK